MSRKADKALQQIRHLYSGQVTFYRRAWFEQGDLGNLPCCHIASAPEPATHCLTSQIGYRARLPQTGRAHQDKS